MIFYIITFCIVLYGFLGFFLLSGALSETQPASKQPLSTLGGAMYYNLLLQSTMGVFTSEALPYYHVSRWSAVYFVSFAMIVNLLLAKLVRDGALLHDLCDSLWHRSCH